MAASQFDFANPSSFSDWANYAGFDRTTGEIQSTAPTGIAPPQNFSELVNQRMQPAQQMIAGMGTAAGQVGQGNFTQALGTVRKARQPVAPGQQPAATAQPQVVAPMPGYDYSHDIEQIGS
jgi:hypothetical protein